MPAPVLAAILAAVAVSVPSGSHAAVTAGMPASGAPGGADSASRVHASAQVHPPPRQPSARHEFRRGSMGTEFRIVIFADDAGRARRAAEAAFERVEAIDARLSDYRSDSELRDLERSAGSAGAVPISADLWSVLDEAERVAAATDGAFDVTVGALTRLWRWSARRGIAPPADRLARARATVGYRALVLDPARRSVVIERPGVRLDLGGIAKGYAVDQAFAILGSAGFDAVLVDGGGDLRVGRAPPGRDGWRIALPGTDRGGAVTWSTVPLENVAVATSGPTYRSLEVDGAIHSHVIDPRTGLGVTEPRLVTVQAAHAIRADALASALSVLGPAGEGAVRALGGHDTRIIPITERSREP